MQAALCIQRVGEQEHRKVHQEKRIGNLAEEGEWPGIRPFFEQAAAPSEAEQQRNGEVRVLCFDELFVNDIGDAIILGNLLQVMLGSCRDKVKIHSLLSYLYVFYRVLSERNWIMPR